MEPIINHSWDLNESEALSLQQQLASKVIKEDKFSQINFIAGVDVAYAKDSNKLVAAVVIFNADLPHAAVSCTDKKRRVVLNFNYDIKIITDDSAWLLRDNLPANLAASLVLR